VLCSLLDSSSEFDCDAFKHIYANILFQFGLHKQRVQLVKYIDSMTPLPHVGLGAFSLADHLSEMYLSEFVLYKKGS